MLEQKDIDDIFNKWIAPKNNPTYLNKYVNLDMSRNNKQWRWEYKDFPRVVALLEFAQIVKDLKFKKAISFNGNDDPEWEYINCNVKNNINFLDDVITNDLHSFLSIPYGCDFFMANQTLEHCYNPSLVIQNIYNALIPGGYIYVNLPAINIPHDRGNHYYTGITPLGLGCLVQDAGFEILDIGFWGSLEYIDFIFKNRTWPDYRNLKSYKNEFDNPCITWVFAKKI